MPLKRFGVARILNKRGYCSRSVAENLVREGRVTLDGRLVRDPETPATESSKITVDGKPVSKIAHVYFAMNKPRGIVTTASDEKGRETVMDLLKGKLPQHVFPVGRLDKASEGLLLFTNDTAFADRILAPETHLEKEYHVQVSRRRNGANEKRSSGSSARFWRSSGTDANGGCSRFTNRRKNGLAFRCAA